MTITVVHQQPKVVTFVKFPTKNNYFSTPPAKDIYFLENHLNEIYFCTPPVNNNYFVALLSENFLFLYTKS